MSTGKTRLHKYDEVGQVAGGEINGWNPLDLRSGSFRRTVPVKQTGQLEVLGHVLRSCPFCRDKKPQVEIQLEPSPDGRPFYAIACICGAQGPSVVDDEDWAGPVGANAAEAWNERSEG